MNTNIKILIADDSEFMRKILRDILEGAGFSHITECSDGRKCLEQFNAEKPDLLLLDLVMPEIHGMEVLKKIGHDTKILIISALGQEGVIEQAKQLGASGYIVKPFEYKKVLEEVARVIS